eukprot:CAMPEP_0178725310 /NCGR_PEP_ID=MMETSP0699-20121125/26602_1 /TAXON_ID=265572 /ORGANISM="Extubocellulus spinifer, Strain CCMP396" /LENGTH=101 /DNA_ID=CAMNT_0020376629 /DNA_START=447 /DNA_END=752 /DNA_ORIENTATION=-
MATNHRFLVVVTFLLVIAAAAGVATGDAAEVDDHRERIRFLRAKTPSLHRELEEGTKIHKIVNKALNVAEDATEFAAMVTNFCAENAGNDAATKEFCDEAY